MKLKSFLLMSIVLVILCTGCNSDEAKEHNEFKTIENVYTSPDGRFEIKLKYDTPLEKFYLESIYSNKIKQISNNIELDYEWRVKNDTDFNSLVDNSPEFFNIDKP